MIFGRTTAFGLILGSALGVVAGAGLAHADDVIVPGNFVVAEIPAEPQPTVAPLPPSRTAAFTPRQARTTAAPVRTASAPRVERVAYAEPQRRRVEASLWPATSRLNFMWIGTVY